MNQYHNSSAVLLFLSTVLIVSCSSDNEHFCARYQYLYEQLEEEGLPPYEEIKAALYDDMQKKGGNDKRIKMMLLALDDHYFEVVPYGESPKDYCMRRKHWQQIPQ